MLEEGEIISTDLPKLSFELVNQQVVILQLRKEQKRNLMHANYH